MMPTSMLGGLALLTSLPAPEADQSQKRDEVRIELLACITRNFLSLEGATTPEILRGEILSRCRPQLPACSTVNQSDAAQIAKVAPPAVRLHSKSVPNARKAVVSRQPTRPRSHFAATTITGWGACTRTRLPGRTERAVPPISTKTQAKWHRPGPIEALPYTSAAMEPTTVRIPNRRSECAHQFTSGQPGGRALRL